MFAVKSRALLLALVIACLPVFQADATTVVQLNLEQICDSSEQIVHGTVLSVTETTVEIGGGTLPALQYQVAVEEAFKGEIPTVKGVPMVEFKVVGTLKQHASGKPPIAGLPLLQVGADYLLMIAPAGPTGLTAPMGLGQGTFSIYGKEGAQVAVNEFNNQGLFTGIPTKNMPANGPVSYAALAEMIRGVVGE